MVWLNGNKLVWDLKHFGLDLDNPVLLTCWILWSSMDIDLQSVEEFTETLEKCKWKGVHI